jgi:DNA-binding XRE family transcriptional regulator
MKQLGKAVGKTESCICQYETGIREPPVRVGRKIAMVLGCAWEELYANDDG